MEIKYKAIRKNPIPVKYCIFDKDGNFVNYTPEIYQAMARVRLELTKHVENEVNNILVARQSVS